MNLKELATAAPENLTVEQAYINWDRGNPWPISGDSTTLAAAYSKGWRVSTCL